MTKKKKTKAAKTPVVRKGHTGADVILTIYDDMEIAKGVQMLAEKGKAALVSVKGVVMLLPRKVMDFVNKRLAKKAESIPPENRQPPDPMILGDALPALNARFEQLLLREMFLNLLAASMDKTRASDALPAFVEVIKQITPDEAKIIRLLGENPERLFPLIDIYAITGDTYIWSPAAINYALVAGEAGCEHPDNVGAYMDNLRRLGLISIRDVDKLLFRMPVESLQTSSQVGEIYEKITNNGSGFESRYKCGQITDFGVKFYRACMDE